MCVLYDKVLMIFGADDEGVDLYCQTCFRKSACKVLIIPSEPILG